MCWPPRYHTVALTCDTYNLNQVRISTKPGLSSYCKPGLGNWAFNFTLPTFPYTLKSMPLHRTRNKKQKTGNWFQVSSFQFQVKSGFTLVELLITISVIAIISAIAYVNFNSAQDKARDERRKQDLKAIRTSLVSYYQDFGSYPPPCNPSPCTSLVSLTSDTGDNWIADLVPTYIQKLPKDPRQSAAYLYIVNASRTYFILWAQLDRSNDPQSIGQPQATCSSATPPTGSSFNYCLEPPQ